VALRREVVVQDGLGDPGLLGHGVHRDGVEALVAEHPPGDLQELVAPFGGPHPPAGARSRARGGLTFGHGGYYYSPVTYSWVSYGDRGDRAPAREPEERIDGFPAHRGADHHPQVGPR